MGQTSRTTKLLLDLSDRERGGANTGKRAYLEETAKVLDAARAFYLAFFLAHPDKLTERVQYFSEKHPKHPAKDGVHALSGQRPDGRSLLEGHPNEGGPGRSRKRHVRWYGYRWLLRVTSQPTSS